MRFLVYGYFEGVLLNFFHFFWFHLNPGTKIYKISNLQLGMCLLTHFMAKTVLRKEFTRSEFYGFWPIWRSEYQYFPLFLVPFESWHKNLQNIQITAWNVPPNSFYGQNRTAKWVYEMRIYGFWPIWRSEYQYFPLFLVLVHQYIKSICFTRGMKRWAKYLIQETCIHSESEVIKIFLSSLPTVKLEMIVSVLVLLQVHDIWHKKTKFMYHL